MIDAILGIAVFTDNRTLFDKGIAMWRARVPAYFYLSPPDGKTQTSHHLMGSSGDQFLMGETQKDIAAVPPIKRCCVFV